MINNPLRVRRTGSRVVHRSRDRYLASISFAIYTYLRVRVVLNTRYDVITRSNAIFETYLRAFARTRVVRIITSLCHGAASSLRAVIKMLIQQ